MSGSTYLWLKSMSAGKSKIKNENKYFTNFAISYNTGDFMKNVISATGDFMKKVPTATCALRDSLH